MTTLDKIQIVSTDITSLATDVIVNAANTSLMGGGGVDGAIHRAAGPDLLRACRKLGGCKTGEAKLTDAYALPSKYIIHTAGPVWRGGDYNEASLLESCYRSCYAIIRQKRFTSVAFPAIACGIYGYPIRDAVSIALRETFLFLKMPSDVQYVIFSCVDREVYEAYENELKALA